jgi:hypothetical protein
MSSLLGRLQSLHKAAKPQGEGDVLQISRGPQKGEENVHVRKDLQGPGLQRGVGPKTLRMDAKTEAVMTYFGGWNSGEVRHSLKVRTKVNTHGALEEIEAHGELACIGSDSMEVGEESLLAEMVHE